MDLSSEDSFRLNVLLANKPLAIRIDESHLTVHGLIEGGEAKIQLHPLTPGPSAAAPGAAFGQGWPVSQGRRERPLGLPPPSMGSSPRRGEGGKTSVRVESYLRLVRELISGHILGSPGGYPIYLRRWTRMGQMRDESLEQLLMLGEPEAVVAAVCAPGLTDELARRAWWAMEDAENARRMLGNAAVREGQMGRVLADYLIEYLPFETEPERATESVRLCLQPGLLDPEGRQTLWKRSARKPAYQLGFLQALPDALPDPEPPRRDAAELSVRLANLIAAGDPCARLLDRVLSGPGQTFLRTLGGFLTKPPTQDLVVAAFDLTRDYFAPLRPDGDPDLTLEALWAEAQPFARSGPCLALAPEMAGEVAAMRLLSGLGYGVLRGPLLDSTATGSLMWRKLAPVLDPIQGQIDVLRGRSVGQHPR